MSEGDYLYSLTTFSPTGKLFQIEYALEAVNHGFPALGIKGDIFFFLHSSSFFFLSSSLTLVSLCIFSIVF